MADHFFSRILEFLQNLSAAADLKFGMRIVASRSPRHSVTPSPRKNTFYGVVLETGIIFPLKYLAPVMAKSTMYLAISSGEF